MGQYHIPVNLDKREFVHPYKVGDGLKLMEQAMSGPGGTGSALLLLLAVSNGRGGGDFYAEGFEDVIGRWGGDRIAVVGDYAEEGDLEGANADIIYDLCKPPERREQAIAHYRKLAAQIRENSELSAEYSEQAARYEGKAALVEASEPFTDITDRVVEALQAEGYIRYSGDGWRNRSYSWEEETV